MLLAAVSFRLVERPLRRWANERLEPGLVRGEGYARVRRSFAARSTRIGM